MMRNLMTSTAVFLLLLNAQAQPGTTVKQKKWKTVETTRHPEQQLPLSVSCLGVVITKPGLSFGTDYIYKQRKVETSRFRPLLKPGIISRRYPKTKIQSRHLGTAITIYNERQNYLGIMGMLQGSYRITKNRGLFFDAGTGAGFLKTFYHGTVYESTEQGFRKIPLAGRLYFTQSYSLAIGIDFSRARSKKMHHQAQLSLGGIVLTPWDYNGLIGVNAAIQVTYRKPLFKTFNTVAK